MDCSVGCSDIPSKDTSKTAPLDVKKVWSDEEAYFFITVFLPLQFLATNSNRYHKWYPQRPSQMEVLKPLQIGLRNNKSALFLLILFERKERNNELSEFYF